MGPTCLPEGALCHGGTVLGPCLPVFENSRPTANGQPKSTKLCLQPEVPFKAPGRLKAAPGGPEDMLVTWLDQEARADERYEISGSTSLGQCCALGCGRRFSSQPYEAYMFRDVKSGQSGIPARTMNPNVYQTTGTVRGVQYHVQIRDPGKDLARPHKPCNGLAQGPEAFPFSIGNVGGHWMQTEEGLGGGLPHCRDRGGAGVG